VDVWLNNPIFPLEASGTSGMKAGFNGVMNLSVLDGWWGEGYFGDNGWAIKPAPETLTDQRRNMEESRSLYELLQDRVVPLYYSRGPMGFSPEWIHMAKRSISTLLPRFNSYRMVGEYLTRFYAPASTRGQQFAEGNYATARNLADWKKRVRSAWPYVQLRAVDLPSRNTGFGNRVRFEVAMKLNGLKPDDVAVELSLSNLLRDVAIERPAQSYAFTPQGERDANGEHHFTLEISPELCGKLEFRIRAYPTHPAVSHRFEMGLMKWI
jgi:starch phosphorylase